MFFINFFMLLRMDTFNHPVFKFSNSLLGFLESVVKSVLIKFLFQLSYTEDSEFLSFYDLHLFMDLLFCPYIIYPITSSFLTIIKTVNLKFKICLVSPIA